MKSSKIKVLSHNYTGNSLVLVFVGADKKVQTKIVEKTHLNWSQVEAAYKAKNFDKVAELIDVVGAIKTLSKGKFEVKNGSVFYNGQKAHGYLFEKIVFFLKEKLDYQRLVKFAENLYANPVEHAREDLYKFLEYRHMPITDDGCFLAYKGVQSDFYSISSGTATPLQGVVMNGKILNSVGATIELERKDVNEDRSACASYGIHVGSHSYADGFKQSTGRLLIVKVNPKDVVAVPTDGQKLRVLKYEVIAEEGRALDEVQDQNFEREVKKARAKDQAVAQGKNAGWQNQRDASGRFIKR